MSDRSGLIDVGFYQEPYWYGPDGDFIKSLLLFFDGIALLTPDYMRDTPYRADPSLAEPLADLGLLHILSPEQLVDGTIAESLAELFEGLFRSGIFDVLDRESFGDSFYPSQYANTPDPLAEMLGPLSEISFSRLGLSARPELIGPIVASLEARGLAKPSEDGVSIPVHRTIRSIVLATLGQLLRQPGENLGFALQPVGTGYHHSSIPGLLRLLDQAPMPTAGRVVVSDLQQVSFDLSSVPLDEVLGFREAHGDAFRTYARDLRQFVRSVSSADDAEREEAFADRREALADAASELNRHVRKAWKRPLAGFGLGIGGASVSLATGNPVGAGIGVASALLGFKRQADPASAYTYLFRAERQWPPRTA